MKRLLPLYRSDCERYDNRQIRRCSSMVERSFRKAEVVGPTPTIGCVNLQEKYISLQKIIRKLGKVVIAYSGGTDSTFLVKVAVDTLGAENVLACIAKGPFNEMAKNVMAALDKTHLETPQVIPEGIFGFEDVHLREITKELLSVKKHLEVIMMGMSEGILELNHDSRIVYVNPSVLSLLNIPEERLLGSYFPALFQGEARDKVKGFLKTLHGPSQEDQQDQTLILNEKEITLNISPIQDEENNTIVVLNYVTDKKRMEAKLQQAQKMEAVGTLAGGIAHDFNNLLMAVQGTVSLILFNMDPTHPLYDKINSIEKQVESGAKLTKQLLGYASEGRYEIKPISLNQVVSDTADTFGTTKKEIRVHLELAEAVSGIVADQGQIEVLAGDDQPCLAGYNQHQVEGNSGKDGDSEDEEGTAVPPFRLEGLLLVDETLLLNTWMRSHERIP